MGNYVSPGVYTRERDISNIIPSIATTVAALVGCADKGDLEPKLITNKQQFIQEYGEPDITGGTFFHYSALAFLENGSQLWCKRVHNGSLYSGANFIDSLAGSSQQNEGHTTGQTNVTDFFADDPASNADDIFSIYAKDPGMWGNSLKIKILNINNTTFDQDGSHTAPIEDQYTFDIEVWSVDANGSYVRVETWHVSRKTKTDGHNKQLYLENVINGYSNYILIQDKTDADDTLLPKENSESDGLLLLTGGTNGAVVAAGDYVTGWGDFENPDDYDIRILIAGGVTATSVANEMKRIAESRRDCIAILDVPNAELTDVDTMVTWRRDDFQQNSSFSAVYTPWVRVNDPFGDLIMDVPPSGYVASQMAYNDFVADPWHAPAGFNRGILNVLGLTNVFTQGERDTLYKYQLNPLQTFRGQGHVIWGQKTTQIKASALDRINVRRLIIIVEKSISIALNAFLFESNTELTRLRIEAIITEFMDVLWARQAFQTEGSDKGYNVVVDTTNNTPAIIDRNEMHVDIFIKPVRSTEYVQLQTIITSTGVSFTELVSRGTVF